MLSHPPLTASLSSTMAVSRPGTETILSLSLPPIGVSSPARRTKNRRPALPAKLLPRPPPNSPSSPPTSVSSAVPDERRGGEGHRDCRHENRFASHPMLLSVAFRLAGVSREFDPHSASLHCTNGRTFPEPSEQRAGASERRSKTRRNTSPLHLTTRKPLAGLAFARWSASPAKLARTVYAPARCGV